MIQKILLCLICLCVVQPAFATRVGSRTKTCHVCQTEGEYRVVMSARVSGPHDLDGRPPQTLRSIQISKLHECQKCGFVNYSINEGLCVDTKEIVQTKEYQDILNNPNMNGYSNRHSAYAHLLEKCGEPKNKIFNAYLLAAWAADDAQEVTNAALLRKKAIINFENPEDILDKKIMLADLYRRTDAFDKAIQTADAIGPQENCLMQGVINHIKKLAVEKDNKAHTMTPEIYCPDKTKE